METSVVVIQLKLVGGLREDQLRIMSNPGLFVV